MGIFPPTFSTNFRICDLEIFFRHLIRQKEKREHPVGLTPAVFLTTGGMSNECKRIVNRVADLMARKRKERYCDVVRHVRTRIRC